MKLLCSSSSSSSWLLRVSIIIAAFNVTFSHANNTTTNTNDDCENAIVITSFPFETMGDTTNATVDFESPKDTFRNLTCGISTESRGIWYLIPGTGAFLKATVTDEDGTASTAATATNGEEDVKFNTALFQANSNTACSFNDNDNPLLECMLASREYQFETQRTQPTSTWFAEADRFYYLHVTGFGAQQVGAFQLNIEQLALDRPANDQCATAQVVGGLEELLTISMEEEDDAAAARGTTKTDPETGDSTGAWPHGLDNAECSLHAYSRGLFYSIPAVSSSPSPSSTGSQTNDNRNATLAVTLSAATLNKDDDVSSSYYEGSSRVEMAVLSAQCARCLVYSEFLTSDDLPHTIEFEAESDQEYIFVVSGEGFDDVGSFTIFVEDVTKQDDAMSAAAAAAFGALSWYCSSCWGGGTILLLLGVLP